ncbi:MAG: DNA repair protein RadC [Patescibacteria group bacterium]
MSKLKDLPRVDRPREKFLEKGADALSKSELLAILLGSGIKGKNVKQLSEQIIRKFGSNFLDITIGDLLEIPGIGHAKALQIVSALELTKRFFVEKNTKEISIFSPQDAIDATLEIKDKKKEHLVCLYLNALNILLQKDVVSIGTLDKSIVHPREIFGPAVELRAASIVLLHNHPSGDVTPSEKDHAVIKNIIEAGEVMGIHVVDFIIVSEKNEYSYFSELNTNKNQNTDAYVADGFQVSLFNLLEVEKPVYTPMVNRVSARPVFQEKKSRTNCFQIQNRRYLGNKYKLLGFIEDIVNEKCNGFTSFCDIFAGTGVVGSRFNNKDIRVISNDILASNYYPLQTFLGTKEVDHDEIERKINYLNSIKSDNDNYFSENFANSYFTKENAKNIGAIREKIEDIATTDVEKAILITSLLYAVDKVANTVGHYDAFRKKLDTVQPLRLLVPDLNTENNWNNEIYKEDANQLVKKITFDVLYIDPPYNSRQYSDAYHLLENLCTWKKPAVFGVAKKMNRDELKSEYCLKSAPIAFFDLIRNANCKHILVSYNNTGQSKDGRSNARINDDRIISALKSRGEVEIFERDYKAFTTGKSIGVDNAERVFYCKIK